ncbi:MAG: hypothetical protein KDK90_23720 [Leptospiraceae bacterium]|nr:hypothetical protein [Leptospiraceae bacterium]
MKIGEKISVFKEYVLDFKYLLFDLEKTKIDEWKLSVKLKVVLSLLKEVRKQNFGENRLKEIIKLGREVFLSKDGLELLKRIILYVYHTTNMNTQKVKNILSETITEERTIEVMTTAERLILEGELKGKLETAINMFKLDIPEDLILKATGFSKADLFKKDKNGFHLEKLRAKKENRKLAIRTALKMRDKEFDLETIERVTELDIKWLKRFFKHISSRERQQG